MAAIDRCVADTRYALASIAHRICGAEKGPEEGYKQKETPRSNGGRNKTRHQSIIQLAATPSASSHGLTTNHTNAFQNLASKALDAFGRPRVEVQKSMSAASDPKAVAREAVVLVMVGLPARGKSYLSGAVLRHLQLLGVRVRTFNAGELRREKGKAGMQADFFAASNKEAKSEREQLAMECLDRLLEWMRQAPPATSSVGILDATNTTRARRRSVLERCSEAVSFGDAATCCSGKDLAPLRVIFLESLCDNPALLEGNYRMKLENEDYNGNDPEAALADFRARVKAYEAQYEPLADDELEFGDGIMPVGCVQIYNGGQKIVCTQTNHSIVAAPFISLLHAMHLTPRRVYLAPQTAGGGGVNDAQVLATFLREAEAQEGDHIDVILGGSRHATALAQQLELLAPCRTEGLADPCSPTGRRQVCETPKGRYPTRPMRTVLTLRALEPRSAGTKGVNPEQEKPQESYADLVRRMRSEVLLLIERLPRSVLVVCPGEDVRRVLLAHFNGCNEVSLSDMYLPEDKVVELTRDHKGFSDTEVDLPKLPLRNPHAKGTPTSPRATWHESGFKEASP
mmetsp:Transcript_70316/g.184311  ORF Transcript_70316/g.184311 Transcript_70316/m.184311 type:complete len:570 (+) Transcript_70316:86-1795(+)